jgi:hypothetical protein
MTETPIAPDPGEERTNSGRCIVAIPTATEPVHHLGDVSEPKHMTMLWLGKPEENPDLDMDQVRDQVEQVAAQADGPLTEQVKETGQLGDENATVWFVNGDGVTPTRDALLAQPAIADGAGAVEQFPEFTPHVTAGYDMDEPLAPDDSPEEIIFDRLGVWDGDEHTEYPLGPSASTEENTDPAPGPTERDVLFGEDATEFEKQLIEAMTEAIADTPMEGDNLLIDVFGAVPKLAVDDAESLAAACTAADQIEAELSRVFTRRRLAKRARELSLQHLIPQHWLRQPTPAPAAAPAQAAQAAQDVTAVPAQNGTDVPDLFVLKTQLSTISDTALRAAYMRGVREYTMTAPQSRPPLPRDVIAQARVNSLIRLAQGDLSARTDDRDLLS